MLIDSVKGVEPQTIKLFKVCRMRGIPIITLINKMDRPGRPALELLDEIERVLGIPCTPINWPVGSGSTFVGVHDRWSPDGLLEDPAVAETLGPRAFAELKDEIALLEGATHPFDRERFLAGQVSPVFFGSAMSNVGIQPFLDHFVDLAPPPGERTTKLTTPETTKQTAKETTTTGEATGKVAPDSPDFSGFVFKIQANMDPRHRDRIAFVRICSGKFTRGMEVQHARTGRPFTLSRTVQFLGQERTTVDEGYAGDILGVWDGGALRIGDTLVTGQRFEFEGVPRFSPEHFVQVTLKDPLKRKQLKKGLKQLSEEGAVKLFYDRHRLERDPILGAVGVLQFEVIEHRLESEYKVSAHFRPLPYKYARWVEGEPFSPEKIERSRAVTCVLDAEGRSTVLFENDWNLRTAIEDHPHLRFLSAVQPARSGPASG